MMVVGRMNESVAKVDSKMQLQAMSTMEVTKTANGRAVVVTTQPQSKRFTMAIGLTIASKAKVTLLLLMAL